MIFTMDNTNNTRTVEDAIADLESFGVGRTMIALAGEEPHVYRECPCGENAHHYVGFAPVGDPGKLYACRNCYTVRVVRKRGAAS